MGFTLEYGRELRASGTRLITTYCWHGTGSSSHEREFCYAVACLLEQVQQYFCVLEFKKQEISGNPEARAGEMYEGKETTGFWSLVPKLHPGHLVFHCDRANYASDDYLQHPREFVEKLFRATLSGGAFKIELVSSYVQSDLQDNSVCLLDVGPRLYIWLGINSSPQLAARAKGVAAVSFFSFFAYL